MPMETFNFKDGSRTYRIQFQIVSPPPVTFQKPGLTRNQGPKPQHTVDSIRIVEITEGIGSRTEKRTLKFNRGFDTLGQARTRAGDYAKRMVQEQMTSKPDPFVGPMPLAQSSQE